MPAKERSTKSIGYKSLKRGRTFEVITDLLKEKIFLGEYKPGDRLPTERELAEMIEVSRIAVREAYHALEMVGIVEIRKGTDGGAFICEPDRRPITQTIVDLVRLGRINLQDMGDARLYLEKILMELAVAHVTEEDLARLQSIVDQAFEKIKGGRMAHDENVAFHLCIAEISRNPLLAMVYVSVMDLHLLVLKTLPAEFEASRTIAKEHAEIIRLLRGKKVEALLEFTDRHIRGSNRRLMKLCRQRPNFCIDAVGRKSPDHRYRLSTKHTATGARS